MKLGILLSILMTVAGVARAQVPATPASSQSILLESKDAALARNKRVVFDFWREVLEAGHFELASKFLAESYIQHNPNVPTGLKGFMEHFAKTAVRKEPKDTIARPLISIVAEGDLVALAFVNTVPINASDPKVTYTTTKFDLFRIKDGLIVEHWDDAVLQQAPPPPLH